MSVLSWKEAVAEHQRPAKREKINHELQSILDKQTDPWGIKG